MPKKIWGGANEKDTAETHYCSKCKRDKHRSAFSKNRTKKSGLSSWCNTCKRTHNGRRQQTEAFRAWQKQYRERPDIREREALYRRRHAAKAKMHRREYLQSAWGRVMTARGEARRKLEKTTEPRRQQRLRDLIAQYDAEIRRLAQAGLAPQRSHWREILKKNQG